MRQISLLGCLLENEIPFVLIGGMAAVAHGASLMTRDLDICVPLDPETFLRLQTALAPFHPAVRAGKDRIPLNLDAASAGSLYVLTDEGNLDCLGEVAGVGVGRPRDHVAVTELRAILERTGETGSG